MILSDKFICAGEKYASFRRKVPAPWFKKDIKLKGDIAKAEITVCGLGFYELFIDGKRIQKAILHLTSQIPTMWCFTITTILPIYS